MSVFNDEKAKEHSEKLWEGSALEALKRYIEIPNRSPLFVPENKEEKEAEKKYSRDAANVLASWAKGLGFKVDVIVDKVRKEDGNKDKEDCYEELSPIILGVVESNKKDNVSTVLLYGHFDKQPAFDEAVKWGPYEPRVENDRLYGRGSVDDGHAIFTAFTAISYLTKNNLAHDRYVIFIEGSEESGSLHLPQYLEKYSDVIGDPSLIISLDSGCVDYRRLWLTNSLRGSVTGRLHVKIMDDGRHSGQASGIVPSTFRIQRQLLERIENAVTGEMIKEFAVDIPDHIRKDIKELAALLGEDILNDFPFVEHEDGSKAQPVTRDVEQVLLNMTWKTFLCITGANGIPSIQEAGNVLRPFTDLKLALRTAPTLDPNECVRILKEVLEKNPPYNAEVKFENNNPSNGWASKPLSSVLKEAAETASEKFFGDATKSIGMGGSVPFIGVLSAIYEEAEILVTGAQGPGSNAHVQHECLYLPYVKKLTASLSYILHTLAKAGHQKTRQFDDKKRQKKLAKRFLVAQQRVKAPPGDSGCCSGYVYDTIKQHHQQHHHQQQQHHH